MKSKETSRTEIFENMPVFKAIFTLAIPNVINQLVNVIYNLADTFYIGKLNNSSMVAALTISAPLMVAITAFSNLICIGSCALIAAALGEGNKKKAEDIATQAPLMACGLGLVIMLFTSIFRTQLALYSGASETNLQYAMQYQFWVVCLNALPALCSATIGAGLRGRGFSKYEMYGLTLGNILNIILDPIFIFILDLGVTGAAAATFISSCCSLVFFLVTARRMQRKYHLYTSLREFSFRPEYAAGIITTGFPAFIASFLGSLCNTRQMNVIRDYSDAAVASMGVVRKIEHTFGQVIVGVGQGVIPLISYNHARHNADRLMEIVKKTFIINISWGVIAAVVLESFSEWFIRLFINDDPTVAFGIPLVRIFAFLPFFMCFHNTTRTMFQAMRKKTTATVYAIFKQVIVFLPALYILDHFFGFYGAASTSIVAEIFAGAVGIPVLIHLLKQEKRSKDQA